ncbi:MAG TPA: peptidoglycan-binding protein [Hyphomicrobiaceae bacterium]|nr:peptidoglycan-binding protein [Hyphomicrobiaceae bacterium]
MLPPTKDQILEYAPHALPEYVQALTQSAEPYEKAGVIEPILLAQMLAQFAHETWGFRILRENTAWKPAQMVALWPSRFKSQYDPRILACQGDPVKLAQLAYGPKAMPKLGNIDDDDGYAYRGSGLCQLTGRAAYAEAGSALGIDLEGSPELAEHPDALLAVALWYWSKMDCNRFASRGYDRAVGNAINRGDPYASKPPIGYDSRQAWLKRALALFAPAWEPPTELSMGAYGPLVEAVQSRLKGLGYGVGEVDGVFGPTLARAVAAFKLDDHIATDSEVEPAEIVGPLTLHALDEAAPMRVTNERATATADELSRKGSTEVRAGLDAKHAGRLGLMLGAGEGARQAGLLDNVSDTLGQVSMLKASLVPAIDAVGWGLKHVFWIGVILAGVWYWKKGHAIISARLAAHQSGANLGR